MESANQRPQADPNRSGIWEGWYQQESYYQDENGIWQLGEHKFPLVAEFSFIETMLVGEMRDEIYRWDIPYRDVLRLDRANQNWFDYMRSKSLRSRFPELKMVIFLGEFSSLFGYLQGDVVTIRKNYIASTWSGYDYGTTLQLTEEPRYGLTRIYKGQINLDEMTITGTYELEDPEFEDVKGDFFFQRVGPLPDGATESHLGEAWPPFEE